MYGIRGGADPNYGGADEEGADGDDDGDDDGPRGTCACI